MTLQDFFLILVDFVVNEKAPHFGKETGFFEPKFPAKNATEDVASHFFG